MGQEGGKKREGWGEDGRDENRELKIILQANI